MIQLDGTLHAYSPVGDTASEMHRLVDEVSAAPFASAHPILQAAYAHYALVAVHPFADGNGRVARALASVYYYRDASVPLLVFAEDAREYRRVVALADHGNVSPLLDFFAEAGFEAMGLVTENLRTARAPNPEEVAARLRESLTAQGGLTHQELETLGVHVFDRLPELIQERAAGLELPAGVSIHVSPGSHDPQQALPRREGWRDLAYGGLRQQLVYVQTQLPVPLSVDAKIRVLVSVSNDTSESVRVERLDTGDAVTFGLRELYPEFGVSGEQKLRAFVERLLGSLLSVLQSKIQVTR